MLYNYLSSSDPFSYQAMKLRQNHSNFGKLGNCAEDDRDNMILAVSFL